MEKNRNSPRETTVTPDPMSMIVTGFGPREPGKMSGTTATTHPMKAMNNEINRGRFGFFDSAIVASFDS
jgi:hypothetical protein